MYPVQKNTYIPLTGWSVKENMPWASQISLPLLVLPDKHTPSAEWQAKYSHAFWYRMGDVSATREISDTMHYKDAQ